MGSSENAHALSICSCRSLESIHTCKLSYVSKRTTETYSCDSQQFGRMISASKKPVKHRSSRPISITHSSNSASLPGTILCRIKMVNGCLLWTGGRWSPNRTSREERKGLLKGVVPLLPAAVLVRASPTSPTELVVRPDSQVERV